MFDKGKRDKSKEENEARNIKMSVRNVCKSTMDQEKRGRVDVKQRHQIKMGEYEEICFKKLKELFVSLSRCEETIFVLVSSIKI